MKIASVLIFTLFVSFTTVCGQAVDNIVRKIAKINEAQSEHVGRAGQKSENYQWLYKTRRLPVK